MIKISPSILSSDFANLEKEIKALDSAGADMIHIDVMDGHFVPNLTIGSPVIKSIRKCTTLPFDVHLMVNYPEQSATQYIDAGADIITFHPESIKTSIENLIQQIKYYNVKVGIAVKPQTDIKIITPIINDLDLILIMTVNPGFAGQKFMQEQCNKIKQISDILSKKQLTDTIISVDGGIDNITAKEAIKSGANCLVAGSYIFSGKYRDQINNLKQISN